MPTAQDELIGFREAARRYGTSLRILRRITESGEVQVFLDPLDERVKLVRVADLERVVQPRPLATTSSVESRP